jgi:hypothetical protein
MNILASQAAAAAAGFLEAKEYETRLDAELQRLMQLSVYTALRKENLVPERKTEPPVRSMSSREKLPHPTQFWRRNLQLFGRPWSALESSTRLT